MAPNIGLNFDYPLRSFDEQGAPVDGVLATDRTHQTKAQVLFDWPVGTSVGARWLGKRDPADPRSGVPSGYPCHVQGRNSEGRLPFLSQLDVYVSTRSVSAGVSASH